MKKDKKEKLLTKKIYRQKLKKEGKCVNCLKIKENPNHILCTKCKEKQNSYYNANREMTIITGLCIICGENKVIEGKFKCLDCLNITNKHIKEYGIKLKTKVYEGYGNKCACCGETNQVFLQIDHVNNDGYKLRKERQEHSKPLYRRIIKQNFPSTYQLLCANCNWSKRINGKCIHQIQKENTVPQSKPLFLLDTYFE